MNTISEAIVEKTWKKMSTMSPLELPSIIDQLTRQQPIVLGYLMAVGHDFLNQDERELLLYLGVVVWQMMSQGDKPLPKVTEKILDDVEEHNIKMLQYMEGETEAGFIDTVTTIMENYNQPYVLRYVVEALMENNGEVTELRNENLGLIMIYLKTIIDCLDQ